MRITDTPDLETARPLPTVDDDLERRGRLWIFGSFVLCPCHLPITLAILTTVLGGTAIGGMLRDHALLAGIIITAAWVLGTARGFLLVRDAGRGVCALPRGRK